MEKNWGDTPSATLIVIVLVELERFLRYLTSRDKMKPGSACIPSARVEFLALPIRLNYLNQRYNGV